MRSLFLIIALMVCVTANAQYDTNLIPTWSAENVRKGKDIATNYLGAVNEKMDVTDGSPQSTMFYRSQGVMLSNWKTAIKTSIPDFVDHTKASGGDFESYFLATTNAELPMMTVERICELASLPTNYFDYTPNRSLGGRGAFTNDATVGHPYGFTNEITVVGGSFFSGSRATWYTTDYWWGGLRLAMTNLLWTKNDGSFVTLSNKYGEVQATNSWASATAGADAEYVTNNPTANAGVKLLAWTVGSVNTADPTVYAGFAWSDQGSILTATKSSAINCDVDFYIFSEKYTPGGLPDSNSTYNVQGVDGIGATADLTVLYETQSDVTTSATSTELVTTHTTLIWLGTPPADNNFYANGFQATPKDSVLKWDIANGFKYQ